jgi:hypothetical protein
MLMMHYDEMTKVLVMLNNRGVTFYNSTKNSFHTFRNIIPISYKPLYNIWVGSMLKLCLDVSYDRRRV